VSQAETGHDPAKSTTTGSVATIIRQVRLPWVGREYAVRQPPDIDPLLDLVVNDPEQNLPYWAEIWPSGLALADLIEREPGIVAGRTTLELGCGLGLTAIAALRAGASLTATDYSGTALDLCLQNCEANAGKRPTCLVLNWRDRTAARQVAAAGRFLVVVAADVLYERRDIEPLLALIPAVLASGGVFWLAEPGRPVAAEFLVRAEALGWQRRSLSHPGPWPDDADAGVVVGLHELRLPG
jgi:predicted nicotinamide N-methyase